MRKCRFALLLLILMIGGSLTAQAPAPQLKLPPKNWQKGRLSPGLKWKHLEKDDLFASRQNLNLLEVNLRRRQVALVYEDTLRKPTSEFAREGKALAAVNAGFFDMQRGGSVTWLKVDNTVVSQTRPEVEARGSVMLKGLFMIGQDGKVRIESTQTSKFIDDPTIRDGIVTGPFLIDDGQTVGLDTVAFNRTRHPRTCACVTKRGKLLLLTVDGRNEQAQGMSLPELTQLLQQLNCWDAVNFDGGGSTTMYIQGEPPNGIVNRPSDNKQFDPYGERKVANALLIF